MKKHYIYYTEIDKKFNIFKEQFNNTILEMYNNLNELYEKYLNDSTYWMNSTLIFDKEKIYKLIFIMMIYLKLAFRKEKIIGKINILD